MLHHHLQLAIARILSQAPVQVITVKGALPKCMTFAHEFPTCLVDDKLSWRTLPDGHATF
jgi:hypothetical protein